MMVKKLRTFSMVGLTVVLMLALTVAAVLAESNGPKNAGAGGETALTGSSANWNSTAGNITAAGTPYAVSNTLNNGQYTTLLTGTAYAIGLPTDAVVTGVKVDINRMASGTAVQDNVVRLQVNGVQSPTNKATTANWPTSLGSVSYGGNGDLWGYTAAQITAAFVNQANFGVLLSARNANTGFNRTRTVTVDTMQVTVYYSVSTTTTVTCTPVTFGGSSTCTATVEAANGQTTPSGTITWTHTGSGSFTVATCSLTTVNATSASCSVTYTPSAVGTAPHTISAAFPVLQDNSTPKNDLLRASSDSLDLTVSPATATCNVSGYTGDYDAAAHGATGSCTGVGGATLTGLNLGSTFTNVPGGTAQWTFANADYVSQNGDVDIVINSIDPTCAVNGFTGPYDGDPHAASGACTGVGGAPLTGLDLGASFTNVPGGTADWAFHDTAGNYNDKSGSVAIDISKAAATCTIDGYTGPYDGFAHGAAGACTGAKSETLAGLDLGASFTNVPGGTADWAYTDVTGNYEDQTGTAAIVINPVDAVCTVEGFNGPYDGDAHGASGACTGIDAQPLSGLTLGASFTDVPGGTADWAFTDATGNYNNASGSVAITIDPVDPTCTIAGFTGAYNGDPHGASGSCVGVKNEPLTGLDLGASFTDVAGGTADWTYTDQTGNYNDKSGSVDIVIDKAAPTCTVTGWTGVFDEQPHGASGSCTGVKSETLAGLDLGATFTDVPGGTAHWVFTDVTGNYSDAAGDVNIVINPPGPALTLDKTADVSTFSVAGTVIHYSYLLTNSGDVALIGPFTVTDDKVTVTCPATPTSIAPLETITCTASYTTTAADVTAKSVVNTAAAQAFYGTTAVSSNEDTVTVTYLETRKFLFLPFVGR
jgi:hypothetical protein